MNKFNQITTPTANMPERHEKKHFIHFFPSSSATSSHALALSRKIHEKILLTWFFSQLNPQVTPKGDDVLLQTRFALYNSHQPHPHFQFSSSCECELYTQFFLFGYPSNNSMQHHFIAISQRKWKDKWADLNIGLP